jgi:hypothetical protein
MGSPSPESDPWNRRIRPQWWPSFEIPGKAVKVASFANLAPAITFLTRRWNKAMVVDLFEERLPVARLLGHADLRCTT